MNYKRKVRLKLANDEKGEQTSLTSTTTTTTTTTETAASLLMAYAQAHRAEAERFTKAAEILRAPSYLGGTLEAEGGKPLKSGYWASMTPLERKREMAHRIAVREGRELARPRPKQSKVVRMPMGGVA
jgi:hypothetical protein